MKIDSDIVDVVISSATHDKTLAVNIMKSLQEEFASKMYISVSFKEKLTLFNSLHIIHCIFERNL